MLPACSLSADQLVPNWKLMTMPDTTPMPNDTANILVQKKNRSRHSVSRVRSQRHSTKASQLARPIVKAGNRMWNEITKPNWIRDSSRASTQRTSAARAVAPRRILCAAPSGAHRFRSVRNCRINPADSPTAGATRRPDVWNRHPRGVWFQPLQLFENKRRRGLIYGHIEASQDAGTTPWGHAPATPLKRISHDAWPDPANP